MNLEFSSRSCPVCGATDELRVVLESNIDPDKLNEFAFSSRKLPEYMHSRMVECACCGLTYGNPVLSLGTISSAYRAAAFDSQQESTYASITYRKLLNKHVSALSSKGAALDIGAGDGTFLQQLLELGFRQVVGVEPSAAPIAASKPNIRPMLRNDVFRASDFEPDHFDLITCFQVMEHLWDPAAITRDAFTLLKRGGMFCVVVHNIRACSTRLLGARSPIFDIEHLQLFSRSTILRLLKDAGFTNVRAASVLNNYPVDYWIKLAPLPKWFKERRRAFRNLSLTLPAGNLLAIGRKP